MIDLLTALLRRHEPPIPFPSNVRAGIAAVCGMMIVGGLASWTELPLLLAPLGATAGLLFGQPSSPLSQPVNVMGGYLIGVVACEAAFATFPGLWLAATIAVGATIVTMRALRVTHPPAAAMPLLGFGGATHGLDIFVAVFVACVVLIALAVLVHNLPPRREYPIRGEPHPR